MSLQLFLIRHGETEWSLSGQYTGRTDLPLTPRGEDRARLLGQRLRGTSFKQVLTSPLLRATQTCALVDLGPTPTMEPDLAEWDNGEFEGHVLAEIQSLSPGWNLFRDGAPGGESPNDVCDRANRLIERLRGLEGNIALFTHGHFGRVLAARWIGLSAGHGRNLLFDTAAVGILGYEHERTEAPAIAQWNVDLGQRFSS